MNIDKHLKAKKILQLLNRKQVENLILKWDMNKGVRSFSTKEMLAVLIHSSFLKVNSFRQISDVFGVPRSTLSDALAKRPCGFFEELGSQLLRRVKSRKSKKKVKQVLAIDATDCQVHGKLFELQYWKPRNAREKKACAKLHIVYNYNEGFIEGHFTTGVRRHDCYGAQHIDILPNKTYVFDKGYQDFSFWYRIVQSGSHFVTRLKKSSSYIKKERGKGPIMKDSSFKLNSNHRWFHSQIPKNQKFRYIMFKDQDSKKIYHFVTSDFESDALEIAEIYKNRWSVELLFRWLKQNLFIRHLHVASVNAVKTLLMIAVIIHLLLVLLGRVLI